MMFTNNFLNFKTTVMNHHLECIICFFAGYALAMFYDYLRCEWEAKAKRRKHPNQYPKAFIKKQIPNN